MVFSSSVFLFVFLPMVLLAYFILPGRKIKNYVLLAFSLCFYAWGEPVYVLLLIFSILINWLLVIAFNSLNSSGKTGMGKFFFILTIAVNLLILGYYKYYGFVISNINGLFGLELAVVKLPLPIGISFFTFQVLSYVIGVWRSTAKVQKNPFYLGMYISMFPQLLAGPIVRYENIEKDIYDRRETLEGFTNGLRRFVIGLGKKVILARILGIIADAIMNKPVQCYGMLEAWYAIIAYTLQIYFDFSGYSDMAIGLGTIFGFHFPENFNYPYISKSITEFWRRWHISLSSFFRDYVYIPLGGNRVRLSRWLFNIMVVWFLTGLWHGANWNFIFWGLYFGVILIIEKFVLRKFFEKLPSAAAHMYAILLFVFGWVFFRLEDVALIKGFFTNLFGFNGITGSSFTLSSLNILQFWPWLIAAAIGATPVPANMAKRLIRTHAGAWIGDLVLLMLLSWSIVSIVTSSFNPFIYFRF